MYVFVRIEEDTTTEIPKFIVYIFVLSKFDIKHANLKINRHEMSNKQLLLYW